MFSSLRYPLKTFYHEGEKKLSVAMLIFVGAMSCSGCSADRLAIGTDTPTDSRDRHPILLTQSTYSTDIFLANSTQLDERSSSSINEFVQRYFQYGEGGVTILQPASKAGYQVQIVRQAMLNDGLNVPITVSSYPVTDPTLAAPIRLSFTGLRAKLAHRCGQWPRDLGADMEYKNMDNAPYWNHGCAVRNMLATQVQDPRDLVNPHSEAPVDQVMRTQAITAAQSGKPIGDVSSASSAGK